VHARKPPKAAFSFCGVEKWATGQKKAEIATTKVHDLKTGRFETRDAEHSLEVLVKNIE
jgi:hypothetical protein